jgi:predicted enzyme related to lactoylglutathione lyase
MITKKRKKTQRRGATKDVPQLFRLNIEVGDLESAISFYTKLLDVRGHKQAGSRCYFETGPVTLQVVDVSASHAPHPAAKALYFTVKDLEAVHARAKSLKCFSGGSVHNDPAGNIAVRPWGERSFYVQDRWNNPLCFVEAGTVYTG